MAGPADELFNAGLRVERIIWLPGIVCADAPPEDFADFVDHLEMEPEHPCFEVVPELKPVADADFLTAQVALEYMLGATGFLVQGASPVRHYTGSDGSFYSGWGEYNTKWFRVASVDEIPAVLIAWAEELHAKRKARHDAKATGAA